MSSAISTFQTRRGAADLAALRQLSKVAQHALWNFSVNEFDAVLTALEASPDKARSEKNAMLLGALEVWCKLHPLPVDRKASDRRAVCVKRHELRTALDDALEERRAAR